MKKSCLSIILYSLFFAFLIPLIAFGQSEMSREEARSVLERFSIAGEMSVMTEEHLGIINHKLTCGTLYKLIGEIDGLWAPPYVSHDFALGMRINSKDVIADSYRWFPMMLESCGKADDLLVSAQLLLAEGRRCGIFTVNITNDSDMEQTFDLNFFYRNGTLDWSDRWEFAPERSSTPSEREINGDTLFFTQGDNAVGIQVIAPDWQWEEQANKGGTSITIAAKAQFTGKLLFALGSRTGVKDDLAFMAINPEKVIADSEKGYAKELLGYFNLLPTLESDNEQFVRFYDRSVMHFFMNKWTVDEFVLNPYFGTGGVRGGCVGNYLWNFGEPWEIMHLFDKEATRKHVLHFLGLNLTEHFAFYPVTGKAFGPWYMVNQEKIIGLIYYYVKLTGDIDFLSEKLNDRTIYEHLLEQALAKDDPTKPVELIDYGPSNSHLELRLRKNAYNHIMPDLNGRRFANYMMVAALAAQYGKPQPILAERALAVKKLLKEKLWNSETKWFDFINDQGKPETRYTIQMYKMINSPVLDDEILDGLISHLNEKEFLGKYGMHSLALGDKEFDPADVDNGGPGACTCFAPRIAELFYKAGKKEIADDIFGRMMWLADYLPYWGDSVYADRIDYRHDTPLQCVFDGTVPAQTVLFGVFGIDVRFNGDIIITPHLPLFANTMTLKNVNVRDEQFSITVVADKFSVTVDDSSITAQTGQSVIIRNGKLSMVETNNKIDNGYPVF